MSVVVVLSPVGVSSGVPVPSPGAAVPSVGAGASPGEVVPPPGAAVPSVSEAVSSEAVVIVMSSVVEQAVPSISTAKTDMMQTLLFLRIIMASISIAVETVIRWSLGRLFLQDILLALPPGHPRIAPIYPLTGIRTCQDLL